MLSKEDVSIAVAYVLMILFILIGNTFVIISFAKHRNLRTTTNIFLVNVAVADILTALTSVSFVTVLRVVPGTSENRIFCLLGIDATLTTVGASNIFVILANLDRYVAIHWPLRYEDMKYRRQPFISLTVFIPWFFFLWISVTPFLGLNSWRPDVDCDFISVMSRELCFIVIIIYTSMFFGLLLANARILWTARKQARQIANFEESLRVRVRTVAGTLRSQTGLTGERNNGPEAADDSSSWSGGAVRKMARANVKAARVVAIVVGVYGLCHFPTACVITHQLRLRLEGHNPNSLNHIFPNFLFFTFLNSGMNPVIYYAVMPGFRDAFKKILFSWRRRQD